MKKTIAPLVFLLVAVSFMGMKHLSDDVLYQGMTKAAFRDHIARSIFVEHLKSIAVTFQKFELHAEVAGFIESDLGILLLEDQQDLDRQICICLSF